MNITKRSILYTLFLCLSTSAFAQTLPLVEQNDSMKIMHGVYWMQGFPNYDDNTHWILMGSNTEDSTLLRVAQFDDTLKMLSSHMLFGILNPLTHPDDSYPGKWTYIPFAKWHDRFYSFGYRFYESGTPATDSLQILITDENGLRSVKQYSTIDDIVDIKYRGHTALPIILSDSTFMLMLKESIPGLNQWFRFMVFDTAGTLLRTEKYYETTYGGISPVRAALINDRILFPTKDTTFLLDVETLEKVDFIEPPLLYDIALCPINDTLAQCAKPMRISPYGRPVHDTLHIATYDVRDWHVIAETQHLLAAVDSCHYAQYHHFPQLYAASSPDTMYTFVDIIKDVRVPIPFFSAQDVFPDYAGAAWKNTDSIGSAEFPAYGKLICYNPMDSTTVEPYFTLEFRAPNNHFQTQGIEATKDGGVIFCGISDGGGYFDAYLVKYHPRKGFSLREVFGNKGVSFQVYPNPAKDFITIDLNGNIEGKAFLEIYDLQGRKVLHQDLSPTHGNKVDVSSLRPGAYGYRLYCNGKAFGEKIIIGQ